MRDSAITQIRPDLFRVTLPQDIPGFGAFIGAFVRTGEPSFLVDPGPASSIDALLSALAELSVPRLDFVLLTHIHVDHAGGSGHLLARLGKTPVVCHPLGIRHMAEPEKLWKGTVATLGATGLAYGPPMPVPAECLVSAEGFNEAGIEAIPTPGHAAHHVSYAFSDLLFAGEAAGMYTAFPDGQIFIRPATPPPFHFETYAESLERILPRSGGTVLYGHYGFRANARDLFLAHREQIFLWRSIIAEVKAQAPPENLVPVSIERLLAQDPLMALWDRFSEEVKSRELIFLNNSVKGFAGSP